MDKPLSKWIMLDLVDFLKENDISAREAITLIGAGACYMHSKALQEDMMSLADHQKKIMVKCMGLVLQDIS